MSSFDNQAVIKATSDKAAGILGQDLWVMISDSDADIIGRTVNTQPTILVAGVATYCVYPGVGGKTPAAVAGYSLDEYTTLVATDVLSLADAARLVHLRIELIQVTVPQGVGAMVAVLELEDEQVKALCTTVARGEVVEIVNFNSPGQMVIVGHAAAAERAMNAAREAGTKRVLLLSVSAPSHYSLMKLVAEKLTEVLQSMKIDRPKIRVIHNADVALCDDTEKIKDALAHQLYNPVHWTEIVNALVSDGLTESAECGSDKVLAGSAKRVGKEAIYTTLTDIEQMTAFVETH